MADGRVIIEAILDTANVSKNVKNLGKELNGVSWKNIAEGDKQAQALSGAFKSAGTACTLSLTATIVAAGAAAFGVASDYEQSASKIKASIVDLGGDVEALTESAANIYEGGFGASLEEVTDAVIRVKQSFGDIKPELVEDITESCLTLSDTMGMDVNESIRGVTAMMTSFGLDANEALDLFVSGAKNGLNYSDELGDNLAEYATLFEESGYSASEMFSILEAGVSAGAYNLDKVNDLVKEFGVRMSDGSVASACEELGGNFKTIYDEAKAAGLSNKDAFSLLAGEISNCTTEQEKAAAISAIFGSQGEDNGTKVIEAMAGVTDAYGEVEGAANDAKEAASNNFANQATSAMRTLLGSLEPLGAPLVNIATKVAEVVRGFGEWFAGIGEGGQTAVLAIAGILAAIGPVLSVVGGIVDFIPKISGGFGMITKVLGAFAGPVGLIVTAIASIAAAFAWAYQNVEPFRTAIDNLVLVLQETFGPILQQAGQFLSELLVSALTWLAEVITTYVVPAIQQLGEWIKTHVIPALSDLWSWFSQNILPALQDFAGFITGTVVPALGDMWSWFCQNLLPILQDFWGFLNANIFPVLGSFANFITGTVVPALQNLWDFFCNNILPILQEVWGAVQNGIDKFGEFASGIGRFIGDAKKTVEDGLNAIAGFFSGLKIEWPYIPLPHFDMNGSFNLDPANFSLPSFEISWYAKGGVFNGPSVIGLGEAGPEAAIPLRGRNMQPFAEAIAGQMAGGNGSIGDTSEIVDAVVMGIVKGLSGARVMLDGRTLVGEMITDIDKRLSWEQERKEGKI